MLWIAHTNRLFLSFNPLKHFCLRWKPALLSNHRCSSSMTKKFKKKKKRFWTSITHDSLIFRRIKQFPHYFKHLTIWILFIEVKMLSTIWFLTAFFCFDLMKLFYKMEKSKVNSAQFTKLTRYFITNIY